METFAYIPILLLAVAVPFFAMTLHNALVAARTETRGTWATLESALQRRYALTVNLPEVAPLRDRCAANHGPVSSRARDEREFVIALRSAIAAHPEIRAELAPIETAIRSAGESYNAAVRIYRRKCESFPHSVLANLFGFHPSAPFEVEPAIEEIDAAR